jgi:tRNA G18 (ribose-2'-O)-methylase SpoU
MNRFVHERHQPPTALDRPRELLIVCPPLRSNVNLSRIVRLAGCCGVPRVICCGTAKVIGRIARDGADAVELEVHRTLPPVLDRLREDGYRLVGLEQTTASKSLHEYTFGRRTALVLGNERYGIGADVLARLDDVVEIPIWGLPYSYNVATSAVMAVYEYCRQFPRG